MAHGMSDYELERLDDVGPYQRYVVSLQGVKGEIYSLPRFVDGGVAEMLNQLTQFVMRQ